MFNCVLDQAILKTLSNLEDVPKKGNVKMEVRNGNIELLWISKNRIYSIYHFPINLSLTNETKTGKPAIAINYSESTLKDLNDAKLNPYECQIKISKTLIKYK